MRKHWTRSRKKRLLTTETAIATVRGKPFFGPEHERLQTDLLASVQHFIDLVATRADDEFAGAKARTDLWDTIAKSMLGLTAAVFIGVLYFVLKRRVATPLLRMTGIVNRLAKQDYDVEVLPDTRRDEIGEMNEAIQIFRDNGLERERLDAERRRTRRRRITSFT